MLNICLPMSLLTDLVQSAVFKKFLLSLTWMSVIISKFSIRINIMSFKFIVACYLWDWASHFFYLNCLLMSLYQSITLSKRNQIQNSLPSRNWFIYKVQNYINLVSSDGNQGKNYYRRDLFLVGIIVEND
jgi:hypothetical protein